MNQPMFQPFRRSPAQARPGLLEIVTPRTNRATVTPAENLLAALAITDAAEPFSLEIAAANGTRWFLARAASDETLAHVQHQLGAAYPQAALRPLDPAAIPGLDPARLGPDEQLAACTLSLRAAQYLPLRIFEDAEVAAERSAQADPVLGILGALGNLPPGWRAFSQLVLRPAPEKWCDGYLRLAVEHPLAAERAASASGGPSLLQVALLGGLLAAFALGLQGYAWYRAGDWLRLGAMAGALVAGAPMLYLLGRWGGLWGRKRIYDARLVQEKVSRPAYVAQVRLAVFAPKECPRKEVEARLRHLAAAYRQFSHAAGNGFVARTVSARTAPAALSDALVRLRWLPPARATPVLNTRELAGLWHLPQAQADVPLVERTAARQRLPLPGTVERGCRIGVSRHQGREVPVHLPDALLARHLLLVGKTRRGKSSLLAHVARHLMETPAVGAEGGAKRPAVVLVDPHRDLARGVLGAVPPGRREDVVFLDVGQQERPFGLNLLDVGLGWPKSKAVANALVVFKREFDEYWGPRMEDAFRFALLTLYEANQAMCAADPIHGRDTQHTVLEVPALLGDAPFRRAVLRSVKDPVVRTWWTTYFEPLEKRLQLEIINPVQTKVQRYAGNEVARNIVGQPRSTIDPRAWVRDGAVVVIDTAKSAVGEDVAALVGGSLINLVALAVAEQGTLPAAERRRVALLADEIHTMPGADYEGILSELAKYGASAVLSTQGLGRLDALDREQGRALRPTAFSNIDGLFAFQVSAADAEYLAEELGGGLEAQDLLELGDYRCYARISVAGDRLPAFSVHLDPPPPSDESLAGDLAARSAQRYGRDRAAVEEVLRASMARVEGARGTRHYEDDTWEGDPGPSARERRSRNEHRPPKKQRPDRQQPALFGDAAASAAGVPGSAGASRSGETEPHAGQSPRSGGEGPSPEPDGQQSGSGGPAASSHDGP